MMSRMIWRLRYVVWHLSCIYPPIRDSMINGHNPYKKKKMGKPPTSTQVTDC
jgi:hypothetical protein